MIETYLERAKKTGNPLETQPLQPNPNTLKAVKEQYQQINWSEYVTVVGDENTPLKFLVHQDNPKDALVRILYPGSEFPVVVRIPESKDRPDLKAMTQYWFEVQNRVMLDETTVWLLAEVASRYNRRQPMILEGMPAVSKTFVTWVFATIIGQPYDRLSFSAGSKESDIRGSRTPDVKVKVRVDIDRFINSQAVSRTYDRIKQAQASGQELSRIEFDLISCVETIRELVLKGDYESEELLFNAELLQPILNVNLIVETQFAWEDSNFSRIMENGGVAALDEINTVEDIAVTEVVLPALEVNSDTIPMPTARGRNIKKHPDAMIIAAQNPPSIAGRSPLTDPFESRCEKVIVPNITEEYIQNVLNFFMTGNDPDIRINGRLMQGRKNVDTAQRKYLEQMPKRDLVVRAISRLHVTIAEMVNKQVIGRNKRDGGSYVFDQRDISAMLDSMITTINRDMVKDTATGLAPVNIDWVYVIKKALREVYLTCLPGDETEGDYQKVNDLIEQQPIWNMINRAANNTPVFADASVKVTEDPTTGGVIPEGW